MERSSARWTRSFAVIACVALACGCEERSTAVGCGFGETHLHARAEGGAFDDIDLIATGDGAALVWSDRGGTAALRLDAKGRARGEATRLGTACAGGVAAAMRGDDLLVACARPADRDRGRDGSVVLLEGERVIGSVGPVGGESHGVDLASEGDRVVVGWRDADVFTARAMIAELGEHGLGEARAISSGGTLASAPSLLFREHALLAAWTESWFDPSGRPAGHLFALREGDPPRPSLDVGDIDVRVQLTADERGPMVSLRDRRPRDAADHRAFVGRLDDHLRLALHDLHSPGRADEDGGEPMLVPCDGSIFSIATRRSSRQVTMVTIHRLDADLRSVEPEQQIYEYHARFPLAVAACVDRQLLIAVGERQSELSPEPRLRTYALRCGPGIAHERTPGREGQVLRKRR